MATPANELVRVSIAGPASSPAVFAANGSLTRREMEVLRLMAEGLTTKAIATQLNLRFKTAACHRAHILQKLHVNSTVTAVRWAIRKGFVDA